MYKKQQDGALLDLLNYGFLSYFQMGNRRIRLHSYVTEQVIKSFTQIKQMKYCNCFVIDKCDYCSSFKLCN